MASEAIFGAQNTSRLDTMEISVHRQSWEHHVKEWPTQASQKFA